MSSRGAVIVEVLAALVIVTLVGLSALGVVAESMSAQERLERREHELEEAESLIIRMSLLDGVQLDQRLGVRTVGDYLIWVDRPEPNLYRVGVSPSERPEAELLATLLRRARKPTVRDTDGP